MFSITADKEFPLMEINQTDGTQETNLLLDSNEEHISKEILNLSSKLHELEGRVQSIKTEKAEKEKDHLC